MRSEEAIHRIQTLVEQARPKEALDLLREMAPAHLQNEVTALLSRLASVEKDDIRGGEAPEDLRRAYNQLNASILSLTQVVKEQAPLDNQLPESPVVANPQSTETAKTYYDRLLHKLKNNKVIAMLLIAFLVISGLLAQWKNLAPILFPADKPTSFMLAGKIKSEGDSLEGISGAKVWVQGKSIQTYSKADGHFYLPLTSTGNQVINLEVEKEGYQNTTEAVSLRQVQDTLFLPTPIALRLIPSTAPPETLPLPPRTSQPNPKSFRVTYQGVTWPDCALVPALQEEGYPYAPTGKVAYVINISFPPGAIFPNNEGYSYDMSPPSLSVNGKSSSLTLPALRRKAIPVPKAELNQALKRQLNGHLSTPTIISAVIKTLRL